jgi:hypothetical protein
MPTLLSYLREKFEEMMAEYRNTPELTGHQVLSQSQEGNVLVVHILSNRGNEYTVKIGSELSCSCPGFRNWGRCKHILFIIREILEGRLKLPSSIEVTYESISQYLRRYSHREVNIPLIGEFYGVEIELVLKREVGLSIVNDELRDLFAKGLIAESDGSLPSSRGVELKSPILSREQALKIVSHNYWRTIEELWDRRFDQQGNHIHISADSFFDTERVAETNTLKFLLRVARRVEEFINFEKVFGRSPNEYCTLARNNSYNSRYLWINFCNLCNRRIGKTLELRGFKTNPRKLAENLFKAKYIANLFFRSLLAWREAGRPDPEEWVRNTRLFSLLSSREKKYTALALGFRDFPEQEQKKMEIIREGILYPLPIYQ